ncbi:rRNA maturation RNase YbeY [bacterium]|nr:rRNA maturation RNase YbeY [bacterium]
MKIEITNQTETGLDEPWIQKIAAMVLENEGCDRTGSVSIVLMHDADISEINGKFLNISGPTDVISFVFDNGLPTEDESPWGEVFIGLDRARDQALEYGVAFEEEAARLIIHGMLHLLGFTDTTAEGKRRMTEMEDRYLEELA